MSNSSILKRLALTTTALATLSGCSVTPPDLGEIRQELNRHAEAMPQERLQKPLTVDDAIALAVANNLDARVKEMEEVLAAGKADLSQFAMLPELALKGGWTKRNTKKLTASRDTNTGSMGNFSVGEDQISRTGDLTATWNLVDFGIAMLRSDQEEDRVKLVMEKRRRALHLLIQDVQAAYWKAVINEYAEKKYISLEQRLIKSVADAEEAERNRVGDPMQMLAHQRAIVDTMRQIAELQRQTAPARAELAGLMGLPSASGYRLLELKDDSFLNVVEAAEAVEAMEITALANRPELRSEEAQFRIDVKDVRTELLKSLPGIGPFMGGHYDSSTFIKYNAWADAGLHMAWNLIDMISTPKRIGQAKNVAEVTRARRLALGMAVVTQVHVADIQYRHSLKEYRLTEQMAAIDRRISGLASKSKQAGSGSAMEEIKAEAAGMLSTLRRFILYSDLQAARARLNSAMGIDPSQPKDKEKEAEAAPATSPPPAPTVPPAPPPEAQPIALPPEPPAVEVPSESSTDAPAEPKAEPRAEPPAESRPLPEPAADATPATG
ncbi:TolC family protein [Paramagnetospirillum marisnigri]|uniref:TolC family protein n=1 Tax=Paramagnetospirillum marisnigri TaxID=1285242 RepID=UPI000AB4B71C|nr:TolC family protein [Paramagnetospirillum marisnigri]